MWPAASVSGFYFDIRKLAILRSIDWGDQIEDYARRKE